MISDSRSYGLDIIIIIIIVYFRHRVHRNYNIPTQRTDRNIHKTTNQMQRLKETRTEIKNRELKTIVRNVKHYT